MPLFPVLIIALPLLGAGGVLGLSVIPRARSYTRYVALAAVGLTTLLNLSLLFGWVEPTVVIPSLWRPSSLFGGALALRSDAIVQPLAMTLSLVVFGAISVDIGCAERARPQLMAALLTLLSAGFMTLWSANLLTLLVVWTVYDLMQAVGRTAAGSSAQMAIRSLVLGSLATLFLWGGALLSDGVVGVTLWSLMDPSRVQLMLWAVAGLLRLWIYPFHLLAANDLGAAPPLAASLHLGPIVGWGLWLRLISLDSSFLSDNRWVLIVAASALAVGGILAWTCQDPRHMLRWIGMSVVGAVLLSAGLAGEDAYIIVIMGSVSWGLGIAILCLRAGVGDCLQLGSFLWGVPSVAAALTLLGIPLTSGFTSQANLLAGLVERGGVGWDVAFFVGNLFLIPSLVRWLVSYASPSPGRSWLLVTRGVGLGLLALPLVAAGLFPSLIVADGSVPSLGALLALPGLEGWLVWLFSLVGGGILAWQDESLRPRIEPLLEIMHNLLRLEWLYGAVLGALDRGLNVLRAADEVVGGAGALLWSLLLFLLLVLMWGTN